MADQENSNPPFNEDALGHRKLRKPPPVTPKRFNKFFAPRSSASHGSRQILSKSGRQLREITQSGLNRRAGQPSRTPKKTVVFEDTTDTPPTKKRKLYLTPDSSPPRSSPCKKPLSGEDASNVLLPSSPPMFLQDEELMYSGFSCGPKIHPLPIRRTGRAAGMNCRILQRSFGGMEGIGRGRRRDNCSHWQTQSTAFYSRPDDSHVFDSPALPFSTTSCNTNSLIATGDETGTVRLIETSETSPHGFGEAFLTFEPHTNAVIDLQFSSDDSMLATASGDQTAKITDMHTQKIKFIMQEHNTSVKQIRFQPGNDNILATSGRDGSVQIWDMRCHGDRILVCQPERSASRSLTGQNSTSYGAIAAATYNSIIGAHAEKQALNFEITQRDSGLKDSALISNPRIGAVSITALSFLSSPGRSHLLLSGSEASTTLKLWDIRNRYSRNKASTPLSTTQQPESHSHHRHFGITSIVLGGNDQRVYALSRDNTVYAYSTAQLILGSAPELSSTFAARNLRSNNDGRTGLGPIYGFRHPQLHATSFYVKAAIRKAKNDKPEMLAVGSSEGCPILFPTDESLLRQSSERITRYDEYDDDQDTQRSRVPIKPSPLIRSSLRHTPPASSPMKQASWRPTTHRSLSGSSIATRLRDTIPIEDTIGTALHDGHQKEVTALCWTYEGNLVSVSDDYTARCWREGPQARECRTREFAHERAGWGIAREEDGWDADDG